MPTTTVASSQPDEAVGGGQDDLDAVLRLLHIDPSRAPRDAVVLGDAVFCGWEAVGLARRQRHDLDGRRCFVAAYESGTEALFLVETATNEGDPTAFVYRTDAGVVEE